jgi:hypothetical protein
MTRRSPMVLQPNPTFFFLGPGRADHRNNLCARHRSDVDQIFCMGI